jgi:hypothetical protein
MKWVSLSVWSPEVVQEPMANFLVEQTSRGVEFKGNWIKAYCRQGEEAHAEAAEVLKIDPEFSLEHWAKRYPLKKKADTDRYVGALRKAGLK